MRRFVLTGLVLIGVGLWAIDAAAQTPIIIGPNSALAWEVTCPDIATATSLTFAGSVDGAAYKPLAPINVVTGPTAGTFTVSTPISQIPTGSHSIVVTAASGAVVSLPSAALAYVDLLIPIPQNLRVKASDDADDEI